MGKRAKKLKPMSDQDDDGEENPLKPLIVLSSSDDEEANEDLSLKIVEKSMMMRASKTNQNDVALGESKTSGGVGSVGVIDLSSSSSSQEAEVVKSKKKSKKEKKTKIEAKAETIDVAKEEEKAETVEVVEIVKLVETDAVEKSHNIVLRKLLRGPRYFDPPDSGWGTCYNCGEEGHSKVNCTSLKRRKKPCFVCGSLEHHAKECPQGQDCFICKRGGHHAKDCPEKRKGSSQSFRICLKCGDSGHDMFSCKNGFSLDDLKEIQCYVCKSFGHLCCVNFIDTGPSEVSCYKCGQSGHTGLECTRSHGETTGAGSPSSCYRCGEGGHFARECTSSAKECTRSRGETTGAGSPSSCYRCGEGGHFARECTSYAKVGKRNRELSNPTKRFSKQDKDHLGFKSVPHDLGKVHKRKKFQYEERGNMTPSKSKQRGGWITDDPGDFPRRKAKVNGWRSPATPTNKGHKISALTAGGQISGSRSSKRTRKLHSGASTSNGSAKGSQQRFSASRFGNSSSDGMWRNYDWY